MKNIRLLLLEDSDTDLLSIRETFSKTTCFFQLPTVVRRLSDGIELIKRGGFDLLLLDLGLPDSNGLGAFRVLYRLCPRTPIVVITAADQEEIGLEALKEGAQEYLVKGWVNGPVLLRSLRCAMERQYFLTSLQLRERELAENEERLVKSHIQLRRLAVARESARETERIRISRELHKDPEQLLTAIKMDLMWAQSRLLKPISAEIIVSLEKRLSEARGLADRTSESIQKIAIDLRPSVLDNLGLAEALQDEARRFERGSEIGVNFEPPESLPKLHGDTVTALFRIFQELLANVRYHSHASLVDVFLGVDGPNLELRVHDNGVGIKGDELTQGTSLGLFWMNERALSLGGEITFKGTPNMGTQAVIRVPCRLA